MSENSSLIDLIKNKNIKEFEKIISKDEKINLNIKDDNYNYLIYYILIYNLEETLDLILKRNLRLDILDSDGRNILYIPIKFSYNSVLKKLLEFDKNHIGINILDIKDKLGLTALHYSIIFNNFDGFKILLQYQSNYLTHNNQGLNAFHICIQYNRINFFIELINLIADLNFSSKDNQSLLQFAIINDKFDFVKFILKKKININNQDYDNGLTALHQVIIKNNKSLAETLINHGAKIDIQDFYGNSGLHYAISEKNSNIIKLLIKFNPNYNLINIDGNTPLHMYLDGDDKSNYLEKDILEVLITKTNLNIQNNEGITCLKILINLFLFKNYEKILLNKELNFFIPDNNGEDLSKSLNDEEIFETAIESYYNVLINNNDELNEDWEIWCSKSVIEKLKNLKSNKSEPKDICKDKIREVILKEKRSIPKLNSFNLVLDNGIFLNSCYYTGIPLDILFGLLFLHLNVKENIGLILDYPLTINKKLEEHYEKIGIDFPFKIEFSNCEILWSFQKIFYPTYFEYEFNKIIKNSSHDYIAIPLGIEIEQGSHANMLLIDKKNKTIERFEPNGFNSPLGLNYNPELLDNILENKFTDYELKYFRPADFLPVIGFQILENLEELTCKKLGDPNGFCGIWCTWWVYHRLKNPKILNKDLALLLIQKIKLENKKFKNVIRNFAYYVVELRDKSLKKFGLDINDWMVGNITEDQLNMLEKEILNLIIK